MAEPILQQVANLRVHFREIDHQLQNACIHAGLLCEAKGPNAFRSLADITDDLFQLQSALMECFEIVKQASRHRSSGRTEPCQKRLRTEF